MRRPRTAAGHEPLDLALVHRVVQQDGLGGAVLVLDDGLDRLWVQGGKMRNTDLDD